MAVKTTIKAVLTMSGLAMSLIMTGATTYRFSKQQKAYYADPNLAAFVRPGLVITITSAEAAQDGTISVVFNLKDPAGATLDRAGDVYSRYNRSQLHRRIHPRRSAAVCGLHYPQSDRGGIWDRNPGRRRVERVFSLRSAMGTATLSLPKRHRVLTGQPTHTIGIYGSRDLNEFDLGTDYASTTFNFVPNGSTSDMVRDVIRTQSCNRCHDQLSFHGGSRRGIAMCVLCHTPQNGSRYRQYRRSQSDGPQDSHGLPTSQR